MAKVKKKKKSPTAQHPTPPTPPAEESLGRLPELGENIFDADYILNERLRDGTREYLVVWRHYPIENATWEPVENIFNVELINNWGRFKANNGFIPPEIESPSKMSKKSKKIAKKSRKSRKSPKKKPKTPKATLNPNLNNPNDQQQEASPVPQPAMSAVSQLLESLITVNGFTVTIREFKSLPEMLNYPDQSEDSQCRKPECKPECHSTQKT